MYRIQKITLYIFSILFSVQAYSQKADSHAPIGVMGDHTHAKGEFMVSYRYMRMWMEGNRIGTNSIDANQIVTTIPNRFLGVSGQPPTLRVVPTYMSMDMHMVGAMYAPTNWLTLMAMTNFIENNMNHTTYQGGMGTNVLGNFITQTRGLGDTRIGGIIHLLSRGGHQHEPAMRTALLNVGMSLPSGSIEAEDNILTPMEMRPEVRVPYPMQLGSGTYDLFYGFTYSSVQGAYSRGFGWGVQVINTTRLGENKAGYKLGNKVNATTWGSYLFRKWISSSVRIAYEQIGKVEGMDAQIMAPVQTANPEFLGGQRMDLALGVNLLGINGFTKDMRLAAEFVLPIYQNLNGPQLETDYVFTLGVQYAF